AGWLCAGRAVAERIPEAFARRSGGVHLLRSPERADTHLFGNALESPESLRRDRPHGLWLRCFMTQTDCISCLLVQSFAHILVPRRTSFAESRPQRRSPGDSRNGYKGLPAGVCRRCIKRAESNGGG